MKFLIALCLIAAVGANFEKFKKRHGKKYNNAEESSKAEAHYNRHQKFFDEHNAKFATGEVSFTVGDNEFTDQNHTEVIAQICRTTPPKDTRRLAAVQAAAAFPPGDASKDWTSLMQPVVNQGRCGSCWAFATTAQLESLYKRNSPSYNYVMSQQYLVDCDRINDGGCNGGWPANAMNFILANGMPLGSNYPYTGVQAASCKSPTPAVITPKLPTQVNSYNLGGNETLLKNIVSQEGPVVVAIYASPLLMKYTTGVFSDATCPTNCVVNHAVVVVGYGTDILLGDYWLVRNSWGLWGIGGYFKMARNQGNNCSIACYAMYMK